MEKDTTIEEVMKKGFVFNHGKEISIKLKDLETFLRSALTAQKEEIGREAKEHLWRKITKELGNMSYTGVLDSNERRRGYDIARQEIISIISSITSNKEKI